MDPNVGQGFSQGTYKTTALVGRGFEVGPGSDQGFSQCMLKTTTLARWDWNWSLLWARVSPEVCWSQSQMQTVGHVGVALAGQLECQVLFNLLSLCGDSE